jgi:RND family efflux transporter MFP subunit
MHPTMLDSFDSVARGWRPPTTIVTTLALSLVVAACGGKNEAKGDSAGVAAATATQAGAVVLGPEDLVVARTADVGGSIILSGPLEPKERVTLRAQISGTVTDLRVDRGSAVRAGQRLASIRAVGVQSQAAGARAGVAAAEAALAVGRQRLEAARTLRQAGAMSDIDFRSAEAAYEAAQAQVAAARAQSASAGEAAGHTEIVAPMSGTVSDRKVQEGESVNPGGELLTIVNSRVLELAGRIGVADAARVRVGMPVEFTLDAVAGRTLRGRVARVDPTADPGTRQVGVYVELANEGGQIIGGQYARGRIATQAMRAVVVPATAVQGVVGENAANAHVLVVENGKVARRPVTLGARDEATGMVAILSGIREGEKVVATPTTDLAPGATVTVSGADAAGAAPAAPRKE